MELWVEEDGNPDSFTRVSDLKLEEYFNRARCECESPFQIRYQLAEGIEPGDLDNEQVDIYFGAQCTDPDFRVDCLFFDGDGLPDYGDLRTQVIRNYTVRELITLDTTNEETCDKGEGAKTVFALVDVEGDGEFESTSTTEIQFDTQLPVLPDNPEARGGEDAIIVSFDRPDGDEDLLSYQLLCAEVGQTGPVFEGRGDNAPYDRVEDFEGCASPFAIPVEGVTMDVPTDLALVNPDYTCGDGSSSSTSVRADGLDNGSSYHVVLVAVDRQRNAQGIYLGVVEPRPAVDFWELYDEGGGTAEGGCQSSSGIGWFLALFIGALALRLRRRRGVGLVIALCLALPSAALAQPYWDELEEPVTEQGNAIPAWNVGFKLGPYTADIDSEFSGMGPFEQTFGAKDGLMSQIEVDRYFAYPFGQFGVTAMLGYHAKSGKAFERRPDGSLRRIPEGENTAFKLLPIALSAVYRLTVLDDRYHIPVVPYGRLGLAYYTWWITKPSGGIAETDRGGKARGGSLGWQGSVGLALRAESLDKTAEQSLRNEFGVEHAGIYAELAYAKVDGFGSDKKLSVGDFTWFAGVNFEF